MAMAVRCCFPLVIALLSAPLLAAQPISGGEYVIFIDNHDGAYLRNEPSQEAVSMDGISAALAALLDLPPVMLNDAALHSQVDSLLNANPFERPEAVLSLQVFGAQDEFSLGSENAADCCANCPSHVRPLQGEEGGKMFNFDEAVRSMTLLDSQVSSLTHSDLDCAALDLVCDVVCQERMLEEYAGSTGVVTYDRSGTPMGGKLRMGGNGLSADQEILDLSLGPELALATELACLQHASQRLWKTAAPSVADSDSEARPVQRHLLTGTLDSLDKVKGAYGKESKTYKTASRLMAKGIGMAKKAIRETFGGKMVGQVAVLDSNKHERRRLLQAGGDDAQTQSDFRDRKEWQSGALMGVVGFGLVVISIMSTICMFSMELKQDTILYGKSKAE